MIHSLRGIVVKGSIMKLLLWVVLAGLLARGSILLLSPPTAGPVQLEFSIIASNLNAGRGFVFEQYGAQYNAWKEPLYIVLLAWLTRWIGKSNLAIILFQSIFGIGTAVGVALIALYLSGDPVHATLAGIIVAANPFLVYYDTQFVHPLSMNSFLCVAAIGARLVAVGDCTRGFNRTLVAGLLMGLTLWQRATLLGAGAAVWIMAILLSEPHRRKQLAHGAIWLGVALLVVSPWLIRNYKLFGRFVFTTDFAHHV